MTKTSSPVFLIQLVEDTHHFCTIKVHKTGKGGGTVLFKSDAMWKWGMGQTFCPFGEDHIRQYGTIISWAEWLHNGLSGMHATILHCGDDEFCIHDGHEDYAFVSRLYDLSDLTDAEVLAQTGGVLAETCH